MGSYLLIANSWVMWLACLPVVALVGIQAFAFFGRAKRAAPLVGLSELEVNRAFRIGATSAIGPALAVFVVMLGLMAPIGGPLAWQRLAIIGAAPTELTAATMAAKAQGIELGAPGYDLIHFANATWVMALNGSAWLFTTALFTDKLGVITQKAVGNDKRKLGLLGISAMCGAFAFLVGGEIMKGLKPGNGAVIACAVTSAVSMLVLGEIAKKKPALLEHNLGISMLLGMVAAVIFNRM